MNANEIKISDNTVIKTMTVEELLTAQDVGDIATPDIQRPAGVWSAEQCAKLEDTISRGWGIGTISIVEVSKGEKTLRLLDDGLQRMTALRIQRDAAVTAFDTAEAALTAAHEAHDELPAESPNKAAAEAALTAAAADYDSAHRRLMTLCEYPVAVSVTTTDDISVAAELFVRLNNGTPLSKIQRGTAGLKPAVLA